MLIILKLVTFLSNLFIYFAFDTSITAMAIAKMMAELIIMLILGQLAKYCTSLSHLFGFFLVLQHFIFVYINSKLDKEKYNFFASFSVGGDFQLTVIIYFLGTVILSTSFLWSVILITPLFIIGNV